MIIRFEKEVNGKKINMATIVGFLPYDAPEIREVSINGETNQVLSASANARFCIGYDKDFKGESKDFMNLEFWGKSAEIMKKFAYKGMPLVVSGRVRESSYTKDGENRVSHALVVDEFKVLRFKKKEGEVNSTSDAPAGTPNQAATTSQSQQSQTPENFSGGEPIYAPDDLPF